MASSRPRNDRATRVRATSPVRPTTDGAVREGAVAHGEALVGVRCDRGHEDDRLGGGQSGERDELGERTHSVEAVERRQALTVALDAERSPGGATPPLLDAHGHERVEDLEGRPQLGDLRRPARGPGGPGQRLGPGSHRNLTVTGGDHGSLSRPTG